MGPGPRFGFYMFSNRDIFQTVNSFEMKFCVVVYDHVRKVSCPGGPTFTEWFASGSFPNRVFRLLLKQVLNGFVFRDFSQTVKDKSNLFLGHLYELLWRGFWSG